MTEEQKSQPGNSELTPRLATAEVTTLPKLRRIKGGASAIRAQGIGYQNKLEPQWAMPAEMEATEEVKPKAERAGGELSWLLPHFSLAKPR